MVTGIIGKKIGMTQLFGDGGVVQPATVIKAGPCVVVQAKTAARDGYEAVQLGLVEDGKQPRVTKAVEGLTRRPKSRRLVLGVKLRLIQAMNLQSLEIKYSFRFLRTVTAWM